MIELPELGIQLLAFDPQTNTQSQWLDCFRRQKISGLIVRNDASFWEILSSNLRIGAIFLGGPLPELKIFLPKLHLQKREIPIFVHADQSELIDEFNDEYPNALVIRYDSIVEEQLTSLIQQHIFTRYYPDTLLQNVASDFCDIMTEQFSEVFPSCDRVLASADRRMYGQRLEYMPIKSNWCAGAMLLETNTSDIANLVQLGRSHFNQPIAQPSLCAEDVLREISNLLAGAFKNKYVPNDFSPNKTYPEIPMTINHQEGYVSFGTTSPMLCFDFTIHDRRNGAHDFSPFQIALRLSFHSHWDPGEVPEEPFVQQAIDDGVLEFF